MQVGGSQSSSRMRMFGMGSGLDIEDMVKQLMDAERIPLDRLTQQRQLLEWKQEDYRSMRTRLQEFRVTTFDMGLSSAYKPTTVTSSNDEIVTATSSSGTPSGSYAITVKQLADTINLHSASIQAGEHLTDQFIGLGETISFTITNKGTTLEEEVAKSFTFDTGTTTLRDVVAAINDADMGLKAFYDAGIGRVFISSKETGDSTRYQFTDDTGDFLNGATGLHLAYNDANGDLQQLQSDTVVHGKDAKFDLNGATDLLQSTNTFVINGVTYNLRKADPSSPVAVRVDQDTEKIFSNIKGFLDKYNDTLAAIRTEVTEKRYFDFQPLTDAQKEEMSDTEIVKWEEKARSGSLRADPVLREVASSLQLAAAGEIEIANSNYKSLYDIGISTKSWSESGKLHIVDETKLRKAITDDPDAVMQLFTQRGETASTKGIAQRFMEELDSANARLTDHAGSIDKVVDDSYIGKRLTDLDKRLASMEDRLIRREEHFYRQFSSLESFMSQSGSTSSWLAQQFGGGQ